MIPYPPTRFQPMGCPSFAQDNMMATRALEHLLFRFPFAPALLSASSFPAEGARQWKSQSTVVFSFSGQHHYLSCRSMITNKDNRRRKKKKKKATTKDESSLRNRNEAGARWSSGALLRVKRRTRSNLELLDQSSSHQHQYYGGGDCEEDLASNQQQHVPVMLAEVLQVFSRLQLHFFVDCTIGAGGHSSAMIRSHPEMRALIGLDVDPTALDVSRSHLETQLLDDASAPIPKVYTRPSNFKHIKSVLGTMEDECGVLASGGVDGILIDLGMSSMQVNNPERGFSILADGPLDMRMNPQASLTAEDILNSWPEDEVGRILREYGEENNWRMLQKKIVNARVGGQLHSTMDLANLIQTMPLCLGGRHGWLKTTTRVFQALRIAVNDELKTLQEALYACFECLSPGGRLAVISFHSLEDRIVKHTFLDVVGKLNADDDADEVAGLKGDVALPEEWIKRSIPGRNGIILTKRPITPSVREEKLNPRCRSAKLRVLQKL